MIAVLWLAEMNYVFNYRKLRQRVLETYLDLIFREESRVEWALEREMAIPLGRSVQTTNLEVFHPIKPEI